MTSFLRLAAAVLPTLLCILCIPAAHASPPWAGRVITREKAEQILEQLDSPQPEIRRKSAGALAYCMAPGTVEALAGLLHDPDPEVRMSALSALGVAYGFTRGGMGWGGWQVKPFTDEEKRALTDLTYKQLLAATADPEPKMRKIAIERMIYAFPVEQVAPVFLRALADPDPEVRTSAIRALGERKVAAAVDPLLQALTAPEEGVRTAAAYALGKIGDARAVELLLKAARDPSPAVAGPAVYALGEIGDRRGKSVV